MSFIFVSISEPSSKHQNPLFTMRLLGLCGVLLLGTSLVKGLNIVNTFEAEGSFDTVSKGEDDALLRKRLPPSATAAPIAVAGTPIQDQSKSIKKEFLQRFKGRWWSKIDKKPKTKYKKMKKPEGFNKKKDSITLARLGTGNPYQRYRYFQVSVSSREIPPNATPLDNTQSGRTLESA